MSKSIGNVVAPENILKEYGADILRLWVAASDYREDIRISKDILKGVAENYRKIRNTLRYLIGNVHGFDPAKDTVGAKDMLEIDRWALNRLVRTVEAARKAYDTYEFHRVAVAVIEFCILDCSSFYFDILKDRLYTFKKDSLERRSAQTVLHHMLSSLLPLLAPILPFTAEETWLLGREDSLWKEESVFLSDFPSLMNEWKDDGLEARWNQVRKIREKANLSLETARKDGQIGSSLEAKVILNGGEGVEKEVLKNLEKNLASVFIVSQVEIQNGSGPLEVKVVKADGKKCARCWRYEITVGEDKTHTEICLRCVGALA
jgi:isoleucyl-tRNA synthetase